MPRRDYDRQSRLPAEFVAARARAASLSTQIWREARRRNDFPGFRPALAEMVDFARREADYIGFEDHPYDALLDRYEPGITTQDIDGLFSRLREVTVPFVRVIVERGRPVEDDFLREEYDLAQQRAFGVAVADAFGYDFSRGRLDESVHPFETSFHPDDVRITTRYQRNYLPSAMFAIFHETGHALYEQGIPPALARTSIGRGASMGLHESQSRMWENLVGRSRPFWQYYYSTLRDHFPPLRQVDLEAFYQAVNRAQPSVLPVEADDARYNRPIITPYAPEKTLLGGARA